MRLPYYPGCTLREMALGFDASAREAMAALGVELVELPQWNCCGATFPLIIDNMLWDGHIFDESDTSQDTQGVRDFTRQITNDPDWIVSLVPIRDGLIMAYKR